MRLRNLFLLAAALSTTVFTQAQPKQTLAATPSTIPFIGCASDGQTGTLPAPPKRDKRMSIPAEIAAHLAYFQAQEGPGVLGPRNWHCFASYGSNGESIFLTPKPLTAHEYFSDKWKGISGPGIQLSYSVGDTSGRFEVARIVARVFPNYKDYVQHVIAEGIEPAYDFPFGPWPQDQLSYKNDHVVEFTTPPNTAGLGTSSRMEKNAQPISGVAVFDPKGDTGLTELALRLPPELSTLARTITQHVELESGQLKQ